MIPADAGASDLLDIVTAAATAAGEDAVTIELAADDAARLAQLAQQVGIDGDAIWRAGWALVLARSIGFWRASFMSRRQPARCSVMLI